MDKALIIIGVLFGWATLALVGYVLYRRITGHQRSLDRLAANDDEPFSHPTSEARGNFLSRWLARAGFRSPAASWVFALSTLLSIAMAGTLCGLLVLFGVAGLMVQALATLPGGVGEILVPIAHTMPAFVFLTLAVIPWLVVRQARRQRVQLIEQDLPTSLDLMATLSEAGLGFDAAVTRILETRLGTRPLAAEYRRYLADQLAGRSRIDCLRRLAERAQVQSVTIFVSALVQSEQMGTGIAQVLRRQADDLRDRRRQQANAFAMTLPVKRMLPLVVCFLPALFVWTLGPAFVQLFKIADSFIKVSNF